MLHDFTTAWRSLFFSALAIASAGIPASAQYERRTAIVDAIAKTRDAIVNIRTLRVIPAKFEDPDETGRVRGLGTGVIIDPRGYVVTNYHVVEKVDQVEVMTADERSFPATVIRHDERADLAVLRIESKEAFSFLPLWTDDKPLVGETVIAIGNPFGLENSVTTGIISSVDRELKLPNGEVFSDLIQTDASINPGNSGGPLLDINGDLLGVNVAIRTNAQGIGFAIPTSKVRAIVERIMGHRHEALRHQGLFLTEVRGNRSPADDSTPIVKIGRVEPDSPAYQMGFRDGDEVVRIGEQVVRLRFDVDRVLWEQAGDSLTFQVKRDGKTIPVLTLKLAPPSDSDTLWQVLGIKVAPVDAAEVRGVHAKLNGGLRIVEINSASPAAQAEWKVGDILIGLHEWQTVDIGNIRYVMQWKELSKHQPIEYHLIRDRQIVTRKWNLPSLPAK